MNKLNTEKRCAVISALVEGCSIRSTVRMTGVSKNTITKLLVDVGTACSEFQNAAFVDLPCKRLQLDEIWSFCYSKQKNVPIDKKDQFGYGDVWTWTAICADTKIIPTWLVGSRDGRSATTFVKDLASRLANRVQITTDGLKSYLDAVDEAFEGNVDYSMLVKMYGYEEEQNKRYSPSECIGCRKDWITGEPDEKHVSTSYVERANLTMRMNMRRFTRLTNAFSKKIENHAAAISLHFMNYNFVRMHNTLKSTPALRAGVTDRKWSIRDIVNLLEEKEKSSN